MSGQASSNNTAPSKQSRKKLLQLQFPKTIVRVNFVFVEPINQGWMAMGRLPQMIAAEGNLQPLVQDLSSIL
jgi:hypothetical protein